MRSARLVDLICESKEDELVTVENNKVNRKMNWLQLKTRRLIF